MFAPLLLNVLQTLAVEDRTETRVRSVDSNAVVDVETDPQAKYKVEWAHGDDSFTLNYSPRIAFTNIAGEEPAAAANNATAAEKAAAEAAAANTDVRQLDWMHRVGGAVQLRLAPRTSFAATGNVNYGKVSLGTVLIQPRWNGEDKPAPPLPFPRVVVRREILQSYSSVGFFHAVTPRLWIQPSIVFITYGPLTFEDRKDQPYLENPVARFEMNYSLTPRDDLAFDLMPQVNLFTGTAGIAKKEVVNNQEVEKIVFETRTAAPLYQLYSELRLKHKFSDLASIEVSGGASINGQDRISTTGDAVNTARLPGTFVTNVTPVQVAGDLYNTLGRPTSFQLQVYPVAEVAAIGAFRVGNDSRGKVYAYSRLNPWLSSLSGEVLRRVDNIVAFSITKGRNTFRAQGAFAITLPGEIQNFRQVAGELGYERKLTDILWVDLGARLGYQVAQLANLNTGEPEDVKTVQPGGYLGLTIRPLPTKF